MIGHIYVRSTAMWPNDNNDYYCYKNNYKNKEMQKRTWQSFQAEDQSLL